MKSTNTMAYATVDKQAMQAARRDMLIAKLHSAA
jgi:hypothetical protein